MSSYVSQVWRPNRLPRRSFRAFSNGFSSAEQGGIDSSEKLLG